MGNRFPKSSVSDSTAENASASAGEQVSCKEKKTVYTKMTSRLAIRGINWSCTSVTDVFHIFASMLDDPSEILSIKLYRWKGPKTNKNLFGVADFVSAESAKAAFEKINSVELSEKSGVFVLEVIPDGMSFGDPVDVCTKCSLGQSENSAQEKVSANSSL